MNNGKNDLSTYTIILDHDQSAHVQNIDQITPETPQSRSSALPRHRGKGEQDTKAHSL